MHFAPATTAALVGAFGGWLLGALTAAVAGWLRNGRRRKVAARLIYAELTVNKAKVETLHDLGSWTTPIDKTFWDAHAASLLYRGSEDSLVRLARAYSSLADVEFLAGSGENVTAPGHRTLIRTCAENIELGRIEAGRIAHIRGSDA